MFSAPKAQGGAVPMQMKMYKCAFTMDEMNAVGGGISGYDGAAAILTVLGVGATIAAAPISASVISIALGVAGGLAIAQYLAGN